ncbi:cutinase [Xylaria sp. CBS 124048]|nr:cutinase [Xylaria sp. CBS 124048]
MKATQLLSAALVGLASATPFNKTALFQRGLDTFPTANQTTTTTTTAALAKSRLTQTTANEFLEGGCRDVVFLYARGTLQAGNLGETPGPQTVEQLKAALPGGEAKVAAQGLNYAAEARNNFRLEGCAVEDAVDLALLAHDVAQTCPEAQIVLAGYGQGAAVVHAAAKRLDALAKARITAAVTFGDTMKGVDGGKIPGIEQDRVLILCHKGDGACVGDFSHFEVAHTRYEDLVPEAVKFIVGKIAVGV